MRKIKNLNESIKNIKGRPLKVQSEDGKKEQEVTLRDYLLVVLSAKFEIQNIKESYWTTELGMLIADTVKEEIEISEDKYEFLKRIIETNKSKNSMGQEDTIFNPFELGQLLVLLDEVEKTE